MNADKILAAGKACACGYVRDFFLTLRQPWTAPARGLNGQALAPHSRLFERQDGGHASQAETAAVLNADPWAYVVISIVIGAAVQIMAGTRLTAGIESGLLYVTASWMGFAFYAFAICRFLLGGKASGLDTARASLYIVATTLVICSFVLLLTCFAPPVRMARGGTIELTPISAYFVAQATALGLLLTRNLKALNHFRGWKAFFLVALIPTPMMVSDYVAVLYAYSRVAA